MNNTKIGNWIDDELRPLLSGAAFQMAVEKMTDDQLLMAWSIMDFVNKKSEARLKALRERLMTLAEKNGTPSDLGGQKYFVEESELIREKRVATLPETEDLVKLLAESKLQVTEGFDEVKVLQINPSKLEFLVQTGKIKAAALEALKKVSWALRVKKSGRLSELLTDAASPPSVFATQDSSKTPAPKATGKGRTSF